MSGDPEAQGGQTLLQLQRDYVGDGLPSWPYHRTEGRIALDLAGTDESIYRNR